MENLLPRSVHSLSQRLPGKSGTSIHLHAPVASSMGHTQSHVLLWHRVPLELATTQPSMPVKDYVLFSFDLLLIWAPKPMIPWSGIIEHHTLPGFPGEGPHHDTDVIPSETSRIVWRASPCQESNHPQTGLLLAKQMDKGARQAKAHG